jgi:hypothetical protein
MLCYPMQGNAGGFSAHRVGTYLGLGIRIDVYNVMGMLVAVNTPSVDSGEGREEGETASN